MPDTGWVAPSSVSTENNTLLSGQSSRSWSNPGNILSDDDAYASAYNLAGGNYSTHWLIASFASFELPSYASNLRVAVRVRHKKDSGEHHAASINEVTYYFPPYYGDTGPGLFVRHNGTYLLGGVGAPFATTEVAEIFGGDDNALWEELYGTFTVAMANSGDVDVRLTVTNGNSFATDVFIDQVEMKIWYDVDVTTTELSAHISATSTVSAAALETTGLSEHIQGFTTIQATLGEELSVHIQGSSTVSGDPVYYDPASVTTTDLSWHIDALSVLSAKTDDEYFPVLVWDNDSGAVPGRIALDVDESVSVSGVNAVQLFEMLDFDIENELEFTVGLEDEYVKGEFGFFFPSEGVLQFNLLDPTSGDKVFKLFRDGVNGVEIVRNNDGRLLFKGKQDKKSLEFDHLTGTVTATFLAYVDADRAIKSGSNVIDEVFLNEVFGYDITFSGDSKHASQWVRVTYVFEKLLEFCGATSVEFGNFNRLFTSFILETVNDTNNTVSAVGWQNDGALTFLEWLAATGANLLFDKMLVYKEILFQTGDYLSAGASNIVDLIDNMAAWFSAVVGVDSTGKGYVVPTYVQDWTALIADADVISCRVKSYLDKVANVVGIGHVKMGKMNPDPGQCFLSDGEYPGGNIRYDADGLHNDSLYNHSTLFEVSSSGDEVLKAFFPVRPDAGIIRGDEAGGFGYTAGSDPVTHDNDLLCVMHVGSERGWNVGGSRGFYIDGDNSYILAVSEKYYEFREVDREIYELELALVDLEMINLYKLASDSVYGPDVLLRPILIQTNYTTGRTIMEAINVTRV